MNFVINNQLVENSAKYVILQDKVLGSIQLHNYLLKN